jgi:hypothetical protein
VSKPAPVLRHFADAPIGLTERRQGLDSQAVTSLRLARAKRDNHAQACDETQLASARFYRSELMANPQSKKTAGDIKGKQAAKGAQSKAIPRDENHDLIAVLYTALQGAELTAKALQAAQAAGDEDLIEFFEETRDEHKERATEARQLLADRLSGDDEDADDDEEEDEEGDDEDEEEEED